MQDDSRQDAEHDVKRNAKHDPQQATEKNNHLISAHFQLPSLPAVLVRLLDQCDRPDTDIAEVADTVAGDPLLSGRILRLANSAFIGARNGFADIRQAVIFLGMDTVRNLAIAVAVHEAFREFPGSAGAGFNLGSFWYHSLFCGILAKELAETYGYAEGSTAYLAGMLHDLGKCILGFNRPREYARILASTSAEERNDGEQDIFGISHAELGAELIASWNIREDIVEAIRSHQRPENAQPTESAPLSLLVANANRLCHNKPVQGIALSKEDAEKLVARAEKIVIELASSFGIRIDNPEAENIADSLQSPHFLEQLKKQVIDHATLYGMLDNLLRSRSLGKALLSFEESMALLFGIERSLLLIPKPESKAHFIPQGSYRNKLLRQLRGFSLHADKHGSPLSRALHDHHFTTLDQPNRKDKMERQLWKCGYGCRLQLHPIPSTTTDDDWLGMVVLFIPEGSPPHSPQQLGALSLLLGHLGQRLSLDQLKQRHGEELVAEREASLTAIAKSIGHEIATPLATIQNYLALLGDNRDNAHPWSDQIALIGSELQRISKISRQLSNLSRAPVEEEFVAIDLPTMFEDLVHLFLGFGNEAPQIHFSCHYAPDLPRIKTNPDLLQQILHNLLSNSVDAVREHGSIQLICELAQASDARNSRKELQISVIDNGPGVPEHITPKLFTPGNTNKGEGHAGLGLAIARKLAMDLGGHIKHQRKPDQTTQFTLSIPLAEREML